MKTKPKKNELFFVKEMPDNYEIDFKNSREVSEKEFQQLLKDSKKKSSIKKAS
jgi:hypothetical protein